MKNAPSPAFHESKGRFLLRFTHRHRRWSGLRSQTDGKIFYLAWPYGGAWVNPAFRQLYILFRASLLTLLAFLRCPIKNSLDFHTMVKSSQYKIYAFGQIEV
jgi:hypothetical protein